MTTQPSQSPEDSSYTPAQIMMLIFGSILLIFSFALFGGMIVNMIDHPGEIFEDLLIAGFIILPPFFLSLFFLKKGSKKKQS